LKAISTQRSPDAITPEQFYPTLFFFFSSRRRHTRFSRDWSSDVCSSDLDSYDFNDTPRFVAKLREGYELVQGCRLPAGGGRVLRSEEGRVGKEWGSRGRRYHDGRKCRHLRLVDGDIEETLSECAQRIRPA